MDSQKQQVADRIKQANNILVTVSANPSVDQLAACIGLTLALNKAGKHATAVFSGAVPSTLEFLQPEKTIEKNTDSLRDFIIALDKSKADKLRYKVEDRVVKIFITPYRTSISEKDLEFSQGDFNVDVVVALGVHNQAELDQAITAHGRILHDAAVITINTRPGGELGVINWLDAGASSLSELAMMLVDAIDKKLVDGQIATAMLTGIVSETDRFSNEKTSPQTMSISAELMAAGANQQLVATKLEEPPAPPPLADLGLPVAGAAAAPRKTDDGTLEIAHEAAPAVDPYLMDELQEPIAPQIHIDEHGSLVPMEEDANETGASQTAQSDTLPVITGDGSGTDALGLPNLPPVPEVSHRTDKSHMIMEPPTMGGQLTAAADAFDPTDGLALPALEPSGPMLNRQPLQPSPPNKGHTIMPPADTGKEKPLPDLPELDNDTALNDGQGTLPPLPDEPKQGSATGGNNDLRPSGNQTLEEIEKDVNSPHLQVTEPAGPDSQTASPTQAADMPVGSPESNSDTTGVNVPLPHDETVKQSDTPADNAPVSYNLDDARSAVQQAINGLPSSPQQLGPIEALNAQPLGNAGIPVSPAAQAAVSGLGFADMADPNNATPVVGDFTSLPNPQPGVPSGNGNPNSPPPVPPPMMPPNYPTQ